MICPLHLTPRPAPTALPSFSFFIARSLSNLMRVGVPGLKADFAGAAVSLLGS